MRKTRFLAALVVLVLVGGMLTGCTQQSAAETTYISIATGGTAGTYYPLGGALANVFNSSIPDVSATAQSTNASLENVTFVSNKEVELAFIQNDITYYASQGIEMYADKEKHPELRGIATWYPEIIQIVARADAGITSVTDLKGKKVAVGAPASGTEANARQILSACGVAYEDLAKVDYLSFAEAASNLKDGHIDAAFVTAGIPTSAITDVATTKDIRLIALTEAEIAKLQADYPFYAKVMVPAGTYPKQEQDVACVAVMAMLVTHADTDEELVYQMTKAMFEGSEEITAAHARGADLTLESALDGMPIELHPGAQRYYDEQK